MCVDAAGDETRLRCHRGHVRSSRRRARAGTARSTSDRTGTGLLQQAPTRSLRRSSCQVIPPGRRIGYKAASPRQSLLESGRAGEPPPSNIPVTTQHRSSTSPMTFRDGPMRQTGVAARVWIRPASAVNRRFEWIASFFAESESKIAGVILQVSSYTFCHHEIRSQSIPRRADRVPFATAPPRRAARPGPVEPSAER
jgi:hypothetical protein